MSRPSRLSPSDAARVLESVVPVPAHRGASPVPLSPLEGLGLEGESVRLDSQGDQVAILLLFLSSSCQGCHELFEALDRPVRFGLGEGEELVVVLRELADKDRGSLRQQLRAARVIVAPDAWEAYRVTGPPFFSYLDPGRSTVATEGVAWGVEAIAAAIRVAKEGEAQVEVPRLEPPSEER